MPQQTLAQGEALATRYGGLAYTDVYIVPRPTSIFWLLVSKPGAGKSHLLQSCSDALILNLDLSATVYNPVKAALWPLINREGFALDPADGIIRMTWDRVREWKTRLITWAENDNERPRMVVLDSLTAAIPLTYDYVVRHAFEMGITSRTNIKHFNELHGPAAYDSMYREMVDFGVDLRNAGYGVCYTAHLTKRVINRDSESSDVVMALSRITSNFYERLYPIFEMVAGVEIYDKIRKTSTGETKLSDGTIIGGKENIETVPTYSLIVDSKAHPELRDVLKPRIRMPGRIDLPETDTWDAYEKAYMEAATLP